MIKLLIIGVISLLISVVCLFQALLKYQKYAKPFLLGEIFGMFLLIGVMSIGQYYKEKESQTLFNNKKIYKVHPKHIIIDSEKVDSIKIYKKNEE